jgi:hypothetical protein
MGGEAVIFLLLAGAGLGVSASALFVFLSRDRLARRIVAAAGLLIAGVVLPLSLFISFGLYLKHESPRPSPQQAAPLTR